MAPDMELLFTAMKDKAAMEPLVPQVEGSVPVHANRVRHAPQARLPRPADAVPRKPRMQGCCCLYSGLAQAMTQQQHVRHAAVEGKARLVCNRVCWSTQASLSAASVMLLARPRHACEVVVVHQEAGHGVPEPAGTLRTRAALSVTALCGTFASRC